MRSQANRGKIRGLVAGVALVLISTAGTILADEFARVSLGGSPVHSDEYAFHESRVRTEVASRFMRKHDIGMAPDFWIERHDGQNPRGLLRDETTRSLARFRVIQSLGVERGILEGAMNYRQFREVCQAENRKRRKMKAAGEIFYGPVEFREDAFFEVWFEQIIKALQQHLLKASMTEGISGERMTLAQRETTARQRIAREIEGRVKRMVESCGRHEHEPSRAKTEADAEVRQMAKPGAALTRPSF